MDRTRALEALPSPYGTALRLRSAGYDTHVISVATGVPADAIGALLEVGERKLADLLAAEGSELRM